MSASTIALLVAFCQIGNSSTSGGSVRGVVFDAVDASIPNAPVRLLDPDSNEVIARVRTEYDGEFRFKDVKPGSYTIVASAPGFRVRRLSPVIVEGGATRNVGTMRLEIAGCDAPSTMCDSVGPIEPTLARGYVELKLHCGADLERGGAVCTNGNAASDLRLTKDERGVHLNGVNGTTLSDPDREDAACGPIGRSAIRMDGRGPGDDFCVRTRHRHTSHVFIVDDVDKLSTSVRIWFVTR